MDDNDIFDDLEPVEQTGFDGALCPSCGVMPSVQGPNLGCQDPEGCGAFVEAGPEEEEDEEYEEEEDDEDWDDDDEEEDLEELDFDTE